MSWTRRGWFAIAPLTAIFFAGDVTYELKSGSGTWTAVAIAAAVCITLQLSFLTVSLLPHKSAPRGAEIHHTTDVASLDETPVTRDEALSERNDRRSASTDLAYIGEERRSPTNEV